MTDNKKPADGWEPPTQKTGEGPPSSPEKLDHKVTQVMKTVTKVAMAIRDDRAAQRLVIAACTALEKRIRALETRSADLEKIVATQAEAIIQLQLKVFPEAEDQYRSAYDIPAEGGGAGGTFN